MRCRSAVPILLLVGGVSTLPSTSIHALAQEAPSFSFFTDIDFPGAAATMPSAINARGQIVGTYFDSEDIARGFLYDRGVFSTIAVPFSGASNTMPTGINTSGQIVGFYRIPSNPPSRFFSTHGFLYDHGVFTTIDIPSGGLTEPQGINSRGQIVGAGSTLGFLYDHGAFTTIDIGSGNTRPFAINGRAQIVGAFFPAAGPGPIGFLYDRGVVTMITPSNPPNTALYGINDRGQIVGRFDSHDDIAFSENFLFEDGVFVPIEVPGARSAFETIVQGINDRGQIVGQYTDSNGVTHGFLGTPND
jgi:probable HAF family extracellular repeat protein